MFIQAFNNSAVRPTGLRSETLGTDHVLHRAAKLVSYLSHAHQTGVHADNVDLQFLTVLVFKEIVNLLEHVAEFGNSQCAFGSLIKQEFLFNRTTAVSAEHNHVMVSWKVFD